MLSEMLRYLPPGPTAPAQPIINPDERLVALGDSITEAGGYLRMIDAVFAQHYPNLRLSPIINAGIGGDKAGDMLARLAPDVLSRRPDRALVNVGVNDVWHNLDRRDDNGVLKAYRRDVTAIVERAQGDGCSLVLLGPTIIEESADSPGNQRLGRYVAVMREIAASAGCPFCDLHATFLAALEARGRTRPGYWLTADGVHMSPRGDALMAIGVLRTLGVPDDKTAATRLSV